MEESVSRLLGHCSRLIRRDFEAELKPFGITAPQWGILRLLKEEPGLSQAQIAEKNRADKVTTGTILEKLLKRGLIDKMSCEQDRRINRIALSAEGRHMVEQVIPIEKACNEKNCERLSKEEELQLKNFLYRIIDTKGENKNE